MSVPPGKTFSELSKYKVTEALFEGFLPREPAKIRSSRFLALMVFLLNRPKANVKASIIFDLPAPLGPTIHVNPEESLSVTVRSPNDLNPVIEIFLI